MDQAEAVLDEMEARLRRAVEDRPFRFKSSSRSRAAAYLASLTHFGGWPDEAIRQAEARAGGRFPAVFRAFLLRMGRCSGQLLADSELTHPQDGRRTPDWLKVISSHARGDELAPQAHVFLIHQGYQLGVVQADGAFDGPVWGVMEAADDTLSITQWAPSFAAFLDAEIALTEESVKGFREQGGYFVSLPPGTDSVRFQYPALTDGLRPLELEDDFVD